MKWLSKTWALPVEKGVSEIINTLSPIERILFSFFTALLVGSTIGLIYRVHGELLVSVPRPGGTITEGIIGTPRFINPIMAFSDADRDLTTLVYAGLMGLNADGELEPTLAENYSVSPDELVYTFTLRENLMFHDKTPLTADDVVFTIESAKDPLIKSPKRANWEGVETRALDPRTVEFTLRQPYAAFLENTTIGIVPKHIWQNATPEEFALAEWNTKPIGSGAFKVSSITKGATGIPVAYTLTPFKDFSLGSPYLSELTIRFYGNENDLLTAYQNERILSVSSIPPQAARVLETLGSRIERATLPRIFGVFFNQNQAPVFSYSEVRQALDMVVDKKDIVNKILSGYGIPISDPIGTSYVDTATSTEARFNNAKMILEKNGWKKGDDGIYAKKNKKENITLAFTLSTSDTPELRQTAELIKKSWETLGAQVTLQIYETGDLNQSVIRPRKYEALYFGEVIGRTMDLFAFWHSSQRNDPGLNIALYVNKNTDKLLDEIRRTQDVKKRESLYEDFIKEIEKDSPTIFTYSPDFIYVVPNNLRSVSLKGVTIPSERFATARLWHTDIDHVWNFITPLINQ